MRKAVLALVLLTAPLYAEPLKTDVLFVGAHPDDDSTVTATLARLALDEHKQCAVISATRGEGGGNAVGLEAGRALGILREDEQRRALASLGVHRVFYLDREDFGFTLSADAAAQAWGHDDTLAKLVRYVRTLQPDVVVTMNPVPRGHGHHQFVARLATEAFWKAADPTVFPEQLQREFLSPWQPRKLFYALEYGADGLKPDLQVDTRELSPSRGQSYHELERAALQQYRSQGWDNQMPEQPLSEPFLCALSLVGSPQTLLGGVERPVVSARAQFTGPGGQGGSIVPPPVRLQRRPEEASFVRWAEEVGMPHLLQLQEPQYSVPQGESLRITGTDRGRPFSEVVRSGALGTQTVAIRGQRITVHTVPSLTLPGGGPVNMLWEGHVESPSDLSAHFTIRRQGADLVFQIDVTDDVITANLAAADNKAHWRTDSVEICLDPGHSEHTLSTCKLGIVPFNLRGQPMAARDADAAPGPVTIPLKSRRTATGYSLEVTVPRSLSQVDPQKGFGLNVLIYDADKADARPGENCNEARSAWSTAETVQGRPWLWGRVLPSPATP